MQLVGACVRSTIPVHEFAMQRVTILAASAPTIKGGGKKREHQQKRSHGGWFIRMHKLLVAMETEDWPSVLELKQEYIAHHDMQLFIERMKRGEQKRQPMRTIRT